MNNPLKERKKGFTLTEVLVVVLIIGVITAVAYPVYTKSITKSRAVEAINLLEMVRTKQIANFARNGDYLSTFSDIGQLTGNKVAEVLGGNQAILSVGKYELAMKDDGRCLTAAYTQKTKGPAAFTFSISYEEAGLGCDGDICATFGNIIGKADEVCNCKGKSCPAGLTLDNKTCGCNCALECTGSGTCSAKTQGQTTSQSCGNGGIQTRNCEATCDGGTCGPWGRCTGQNCGTKPKLTQNCGNCGTQSGAVVCDTNTGRWGPVNWSQCSGEGFCSPNAQQECGKGGRQTCNNSCNWGLCTGEKKDCTAPKPTTNQKCGNCGTQTRPVLCNDATGKWVISSWSTCPTEECAPGTVSGECNLAGTSGSGGKYFAGVNICNAQCKYTCLACANNTIQTRNITKCGEESSTCKNNTWGAWAVSKEPGDCEPGDFDDCYSATNVGSFDGGAVGLLSGASVASVQASGGCAKKARCDDQCKWQEVACKPGAIGQKTTPKCGEQKRTCNTAYTWGTWTITRADGVCEKGNVRTCGGANGSQSCGNDCQWGACSCASGYILTNGDCVKGGTDPNGPDCCTNSSYCCSGATNATSCSTVAAQPFLWLAKCANITSYGGNCSDVCDFGSKPNPGGSGGGTVGPITPGGHTTVGG